MRVIHATNSILPKILKVEAITIYPYIFYAYKFPERYLKQHEMVHIDQVRRLGWLKFYFSYLVEYIRLYIRLRDKDKAYYAISYEIEAYNKQHIYREDFS